MMYAMLADRHKLGMAVHQHRWNLLVDLVAKGSIDASSNRLQIRHSSIQYAALHPGYEPLDGSTHADDPLNCAAWRWIWAFAHALIIIARKDRHGYVANGWCKMLVKGVKRLMQLVVLADA